MPKKYLLLCATKPEWGEFKKKYRFEPAAHSVGFPFYRLTDGGNDYYLCQMGIGPSRAQACVQALSALSPKIFDHVIHFGLAGGLKPGFKPGDLVLPEKIVNLEGEALHPEPEMLERARTELKSLKLAYREGCLLTSETVLSTPAQKRKAAILADIVDMETYPVARIFLQRRIPFLPVRAIFDPVDWDLTALDDSLNSDGTVKAGRLAREILTQPKLLLSLPRYQKAASLGNRAIVKFISAFLEKD